MTTCCRAASAPPAPPTEISKAARARAAGRIWSARRWPPPRRSKATLWTFVSGVAWKGRNNRAAIHQTHRHGRTDGPRERGHRPDGAEAIPEAADARRLREGFVLRLALPAGREAKSGFRAEPAAIQGRKRDSGAREFRMRLEPRARAVGDFRLRISRDSGAELRGHFLQQLLQEW